MIARILTFTVVGGVVMVLIQLVEERKRRP
jgi:hypothetical protein